jgi:serine/threonine-protein kinase RsbW
VDADWLRRVTRDERHLDLALRAGFAGYIAVPLMAEDRVLGVITLASGADREPFSYEDAELATELARQVALLAARAERFDVEYRASHALQAALLPPPPPPIPGLATGVRYLPASRWAEVGGDFYDVLPLADGSVAFAVGDVVGHDLTAAATMGQIRSVYRALMSDGAGPAQVVDRMQASWPALGLERMATAVFGRLHPATGEVRLASAGHPAPLLVDDDGARLLPVEPTTLLGVPLGPTPEWSGVVPPGATLLLYTDGLVETRTQPLHEGLDRLVRAAQGAAAHDPESLCDVLLAQLVERHRSDDVALLALGRPPA